MMTIQVFATLEPNDDETSLIKFNLEQGSDLFVRPPFCNRGVMTFSRFTVHRITNQEAKYKLCRVRGVETGPKNVPFLYTSDGRTIRYADPAIKVLFYRLR